MSPHQPVPVARRRFKDDQRIHLESMGNPTDISRVLPAASMRQRRQGWLTGLYQMGDDQPRC
jgi:hypothetical protein